MWRRLFWNDRRTHWLACNLVTVLNPLIVNGVPCPGYLVRVAHDHLPARAAKILGLDQLETVGCRLRSGRHYISEDARRGDE